MLYLEQVQISTLYLPFMITILQIKDSFVYIYNSAKELLHKDIFQFGGSSFNIASFLVFVFSIVAIFLLSSLIKRLLVKKLLASYIMNVGVRQSIGNIVRYTILFFGLFIIIQTTGIDLSSLSFIAGALGVGVGFGLQNITSNFISGIIIMFERPIKIGDRIEVGKSVGNVIKISARSTTMITNDNIAIIIPNSDFINSTVINWNYNQKNIRLNIPIHVSYNETPSQIKKVLLKIASENAGVSQNPNPDVLFDRFDDSALVFNLRVWTSKYSDNPNVLKSQLYYSVFEQFKKEEIVFPFPQLEVQIKESLSAKKLKITNNELV